MYLYRSKGRKRHQRRQFSRKKMIITMSGDACVLNVEPNQ